MNKKEGFDKIRVGEYNERRRKEKKGKDRERKKMKSYNFLKS